MKCPTCGNFSIKQNYQEHCGYIDDGMRLNWTTRKQREKEGLMPDECQKLIVPPIDNTWYGCVMCNEEFDDEGNVYKEKKMYPFNKDNYWENDQVE